MKRLIQILVLSTFAVSIYAGQLSLSVDVLRVGRIVSGYVAPVPVVQYILLSEDGQDELLSEDGQDILLSEL